MPTAGSSESYSFAAELADDAADGPNSPRLSSAHVLQSEP
jgi:hypothetical protein